MKKCSEQEKLRAQKFQRRIVLQALSGCKSIQPLIHRCRFSSENVPYGIVQPSNLGYHKSLINQMPEHYRNVGCVTLSGKRMMVHYGALSPIFPKCIISVTNRGNGDFQDFLFRLYEEIPDLTVSSIEYAIDYFCSSSEAVSRLFYTFRRYCYFHHTRKTSMSGGKFYGWNEPREMNAVYHVWHGFNERWAKADRSFKSQIVSNWEKGKKPFIRKYSKIYERGPDNARMKNGWRHDTVDRVRKELTLYNSSKVLKKHGISTLHDLLMDTRFYRLHFPGGRNLDEISYRNFKPYKGVSADWEDYWAVDSEGNMECLMEEYLQSNSNRVRDYLEHNALFERFKEREKEAIKAFDAKWVQGYKLA